MIKDEAQKDLDEALPALDFVVKCLQRLKKEHITEVKNMGSPPAGVKLTMEAVCIITQTPYERIPDPNDPSRRINSYWGPSLKLVGKPKFLQMLMSLDIENVPERVFQKLRNDYLIGQKKLFNPKRIKKASEAAEGLCKWVIAMCEFQEVEFVHSRRREKLDRLLSFRAGGSYGYRRRAKAALYCGRSTK